MRQWHGRHCVVESSHMHFRATILEPELHDFKLLVAAPAEPALPAEDAPDAPLRFEPPPYRRTDAPLLWRQKREEPLSCAPLLSRPTVEHIWESVGRRGSGSQGVQPNRAGPWRLAGWAALGLGALLLAAVAMVLEQADEDTTPTGLSRSAAISAAGAITTFPTKLAKAPSLPVVATSLALTPATSPDIPLFSEPTAYANRPVAPIERERDARATKVDRLPPDRDLTSSVPADVPALPPAVVADRSDTEPSSALALLPEGMPPRVLIRYLGSSAEARRRAEGLAKALIGQGVDVADVRQSVAPIRTELSFSYAPDQAIAQQVGRLTGIPPTRAALTKDGLIARPGTVQLSISGR
jgi:hypothetical protein